MELNTLMRSAFWASPDYMSYPLTLSTAISAPGWPRTGGRTAVCGSELTYPLAPLFRCTSLRRLS